MNDRMAATAGIVVGLALAALLGLLSDLANALRELSLR